LPFATPSAAVQAAQAGDTVVVYAGTYTNPSTITGSNVLVKDGVKVFCYPNVEINYTSTLGGNSPFWDQGVDVDAQILGFANIRINNGISPDFQLWLTAPNSRLSVQCNKLSMRRRIRCTNGLKLHIECHEEIRCTYVQILSIRLAPDTNMDFRLTAHDFYATREDAGLDTDYSTLGLWNFGEDGSIYMNFIKIHVGDTFFLTGYFFMLGIKCPLYFHYNKMVYTSDITWDQNHKLLLASFTNNAQWNASLHVSHIGQFIRFIARPPSLWLSRGVLELKG